MQSKIRVYESGRAEQVVFFGITCLCNHVERIYVNTYEDVVQ